MAEQQQVTRTPDATAQMPQPAADQTASPTPSDMDEEEFFVDDIVKRYEGLSTHFKQRSGE